MKFPNNNHELTEIFKNVRAPEISEFNGEYFVDMLTVLPSLREFFHRKVFYAEDGGVVGYNVFFKDIVWGRFFVEEGICEEVNSLKVAVINYDRVENSFISNGIRDHVGCIEEGTLYLGRLNYLFKGKLRFLGYFSLSKATKNEKTNPRL